MKFIGDERTNLDQEKDLNKKYHCNNKVNDSQKDPKDIGNDKNNNTFYFTSSYIILIENNRIFWKCLLNASRKIEKSFFIIYLSYSKASTVYKTN